MSISNANSCLDLTFDFPGGSTMWAMDLDYMKSNIMTHRSNYSADINVAASCYYESAKTLFDILNLFYLSGNLTNAFEKIHLVISPVNEDKSPYVLLEARANLPDTTGRKAIINLVYSNAKTIKDMNGIFAIRLITTTVTDHIISSNVLGDPGIYMHDHIDENSAVWKYFTPQAYVTYGGRIIPENTTYNPTIVTSSGGGGPTTAYDYSDLSEGGFHEPAWRHFRSHTDETCWIANTALKYSENFPAPTVMITRINELFRTANDKYYASTEPAKCVAGWTKIMTSEGEKEIRILANNTARVWNGEVYSVVTIEALEDNTESLIITFKSGKQLFVTQDHVFLTPDGTKTAKELKVLDRLAAWIRPDGLADIDSVSEIQTGPVLGTVYHVKDPLLHRAMYNGIITVN